MGLPICQISYKMPVASLVIKTTIATTREIRELLEVQSAMQMENERNSRLIKKDASFKARAVIVEEKVRAELRTRIRRLSLVAVVAEIRKRRGPSVNLLIVK